MNDNHPPYPRLWHCAPGSRIILEGERKPRTISHFQGRHAVMQDGLIVTRCHLVRRECMKFGFGGWKPKESP